MKTTLLIAFVLINMQSFAQTNSNTDTASKQMLPANDTINPYFKKDSLGNITFYSVQIESYFPGGTEGWRNFLVANLNVEGVKDSLPKKLLNKKFKQSAMVEFTVCTDGSLCDFKVINDVHPLIKKEALRVMSLSPNWKPGVQNNQYVRSRKRQKITFVID